MALDPVSALLDIGGKLCEDCAISKPLTEFSFRNDSQKYRPYCKPCASIRQKAKYPLTKDRQLLAAKQWKEDNPLAKLLKSAKNSAAKKGLTFCITEDDLFIPEYCPYLKTPITNIIGKGCVWTNASIDRIDSSKGYVPGNVQIISRKANSMKQDANAESLLIFAKAILEMQGESYVFRPS